MSYSQNFEEEVILSYFGDHTGTLLDIGANDGITLSNSRALIEHGWHGDLVEPSPAAFQKLSELYADNPSVSIHEYAITHDGQTVLYESGSHLNKGDVALLSTTVRSEMERWHKETFTPVRVKSLSVESFLKVATYKRYDFISIDAESMDLHILKQMNLKEINCRCLCIEWNLNKNMLQEIINYCALFGLNKVICKNSENVILAI